MEDFFPETVIAYRGENAGNDVAVTAGLLALELFDAGLPVLVDLMVGAGRPRGFLELRLDSDSVKMLGKPLPKVLILLVSKEFLTEHDGGRSYIQESGILDFLSKA